MAFKNDFKPDIVIGNPPYNSGMDIDFLIDAHKIAKIGTSFIVPSKWQTAEADQRIDSIHSYGDFRREVVPHMSKVVFYPQSINVFNIYQIDGISWYVTSSNKEYEETIVENICIEQKLHNNKERRSIRNAETLYNLGNSVLNEIGDFESFKFNYSTDKRYQVWTNTQISGSGSRFMSNDGTATVIGVSRILDSDKNETCEATASKCIFSSDKYCECENFVSWINTKFVRFLVGINTSKLTGILTDHYFRFVPKPEGFLEKYTDDKLYKYYKLSENSIDIIERCISSK